MFFQCGLKPGWWIWRIRSQALCIEFPGRCQAMVIAVEISSHWTVKKNTHSTKLSPRSTTTTKYCITFASLQANILSCFFFSSQGFFLFLTLTTYVESIEHADVCTQSAICVHCLFGHQIHRTAIEHATWDELCSEVFSSSSAYLLLYVILSIMTRRTCLLIFYGFAW